MYHVIHTINQKREHCHCVMQIIILSNILNDNVYLNMYNITALSLSACSDELISQNFVNDSCI